MHYVIISLNPTKVLSYGWGIGLPDLTVYPWSSFGPCEAREISKEQFNELIDSERPSKTVAEWFGVPYQERIPEQRGYPSLVEVFAGEQGFDQPCRFGNHVGGHAVYCHNGWWIDAPRKCRRTWFTGGEVRDEDCPGFEPNVAPGPMRRLL